MINTRYSFEKQEYSDDMTILYLVQQLSVETVQKLADIDEQIRNKVILGISYCRRLYNYTGLDSIANYSICNDYQQAIKHLDVQKLLEMHNGNYKIIMRIIKNFDLVSISIGYEHTYNTSALQTIMDSLVNLQYLQINAGRPTVDSDDVYKYFLYNKKGIKQIRTYNIQFIHEHNQHDQYFDSPTKIKQVVTQIIDPIVGISTLSTDYFSNLQYLYLQISTDLSQMTLKHDRVTTIKIESTEPKQVYKCFKFDCPKLERFLIVNPNIIIQKHQLISLFLNCPKLLKCQVAVNYTFTKEIPINYQNQSLRELQIQQLNIFEYNTELTNDRLLNNYDAVRVSKFFPNLEVLYILNIFSPVTDCDVLQIILNNYNLVKLRLTNLQQIKQKAHKYFQIIQQQNSRRKTQLANLVYNFQKEEMIKQNMIINQNINQNLQKYFEVDYLKQYPFKLKSLILQNVFVTDQLFKQLFLLNINYQLEELWLENLNISDATIYIMLTGSEMHEQDESNKNMKQKCYILNSQLGNIQQMYDLAYFTNIRRDSLQHNMVQLSKTQKFDCYVNDFIEDEKQTYQLRNLSILNCQQITPCIVFALMYTGDRMRFMQFDFTICPLFMRHINQHKNIMVSILDGNDIDKYIYQIIFESDSHLYLFSDKKQAPIQFSDLRSPQYIMS